MAAILCTAACHSETLTLGPDALPNPELGVAYSAQVSASGGTEPYRFQVRSGELPPGLSLNSSGVLSGAPSRVGTSNFTLEAEDTEQRFGARDFQLTVAPPSMKVSPASLPNASRTQPFHQALTVNSGAPPSSFTLKSGSLPPGLGLGTSGVLSGTPTTLGSFDFAVQVADSSPSPGPYLGEQRYTLVVEEPTLTISPTLLPQPVLGTLYSPVTFTAANGTAPFTFALRGGSLPAGMSLSSGGVLSGRPTSSGTFNFVIGALDIYGVSGNQTYSVSVPPVKVTPATFNPVLAWTALSATFTASGGTPPYTFSLSSGALPPGMALSSKGSFSGTPTAPGIYTFSLVATDASDAPGPFSSVSQSFTVSVTAPTIVLSPSSLPPATRGVPYSQAVSSSGGTEPYTYSLTSGALPAGMAFTSGGLFMGTPSTSGSYTFTLRTTDAHGFFASQSYTVQVN